METPRLRVVPINRLPRQVGVWTCTGDLPIEAKVYTVLPDAGFLSRAYRDDRGRVVEIFLETSQDAQMFHSPTQCMPAQNWNITQSRSCELRSAASLPMQTAATAATRTTATEMRLESAGQRLLALYWYTSERQLDKWEALKSKALNGRTPTRLFVRILVPSVGDYETAGRTAQDMAQSLLPIISDLEAQSK